MARRKAEMILELIDRATRPARRFMALQERMGQSAVSATNRQIEANNNHRASLKGQAVGVLALAGTLFGLTEPAVQAERRLAEVAKVVDFQSPDGFKVLQRDIRELVTSDGLIGTAQGITDIVAAAGRMSVVEDNLPDAEQRRQLLEFATSASKMAVAFGVSAEESGTTLARWRLNLKLSHEEALALGDTVNFLGNTMATNEADILSVINRQGVVAKTAGLAENEIAALSATLLAAGAAPEIASTGLKNFTNAMVKGEGVTGRQREAFEALGIDSVELAKRMQTDAAGGILSVVDAFQEIEPYRRNSLVGDLFGDEAKGAITPLIANAELLRQTFAKTADTTQFLGLMEKEYQSQAATTFSQRQRLLEYVKGLSVAVGTILLPQLLELMQTIMPLVAQVTQWAEAHPELISLLVKLAAGVLGLKVASLALRFAFVTLYGPILQLIRFGGGMLILLPRLAFGMLGLLNPINLVRGAFVALKFALIATGIGAIVVGLAVAGTWIYNNWSGLKEFFIGFGEAFLNALGPARPLAEGVITAVKKLWSWVSQLLGPLDASAEQWAKWGRLAGEAVGNTINWVISLPGKITGAFADFSLYDTGVAMIQSLWDGAKSILSNMVEELKATINSIMPEGWNDHGEATSGRINQLAARPGSNAAATPGPPIARGFAKGGAFGPGPIRVGEAGEELIYAKRSGFVAHNRALRQMMDLSSRARRGARAAAVGMAGLSAAALPAGAGDVDGANSTNGAQYVRAAGGDGGISLTAPITLTIQGNVDASTMPELKEELARFKEEVADLVAEAQRQQSRREHK